MKNVKFFCNKLVSDVERSLFFSCYSNSISVEEMTHKERSLIEDLEKCDFGEIHAMHVAKVEARRNMSKDEKLVYFHSFAHETRDVSLLFFWSEP